MSECERSADVQHLHLRVRHVQSADGEVQVDGDDAAVTSWKLTRDAFGTTWELQWLARSLAPLKCGPCLRTCHALLCSAVRCS